MAAKILEILIRQYLGKGFKQPRRFYRIKFGNQFLKRVMIDPYGVMKGKYNVWGADVPALYHCFQSDMKILKYRSYFLLVRRGHWTGYSIGLIHGKISNFKNITGCRTSGCEMVQKTLVICFGIT